MGNSKVRRMAIALFVLCITFFVFAVDIKAADTESVQKVDDCERAVKDYDASEVKTYLSKQDYPKLEGYLFSGWYTDEACNESSALGGNTPKGTVYALFVPEHILSVKAQVSKNLLDEYITNDDSASLRFVTSVDTLLYQKVGFEVSYVDLKGKIHRATNESKKVYKQLYVAGSNSEVWEEVTPESEFCGVSSYFRACTITGIPTQYYETEFVARPFWVTLDGTKVYGEKITKKIVDGCIRSEVWVSSEETTAGKDKCNYGSFDYPYETLDFALCHVEDGGVVCVKDNLMVAGREVWTSYGKQVTITGNNRNEQKETLQFEASVIDIFDAVSFENLHMEFADDTTIYAWGNKLKIGSDVTGIDNELAKALTVYGGGRTTHEGDTQLELYAGNYQNIYGGGRGIVVTGDTNVVVGGSVIAKSIYGGCYNITSLDENSSEIVWETTGHVAGYANVSIVDADEMSQLSGALKDDGIVATSYYKESFNDEYGVFILRDSLYESFQQKTGQYHYLVQATAGGEVYSAGECLRIVPDEGKSAVVRLQTSSGDVVFYTEEESFYPLPELHGEPFEIHVQFETKNQTTDKDEFIRTAEARINSAYYKTVEEAIMAAEKMEAATIISLDNSKKFVEIKTKTNGRGTVNMNKKNYLVGDTVFVTALPKIGYDCKNLIVKQNGETVVLDGEIASSGGTCSFKATEEIYTIEVTFELKESSEDNDYNTNNEKGYYTAIDYMENSSLFVPVWKDEWTPPTELVNFEKKWETFFEPNGRMMSTAHRGGNDIHYPENSIEGIMSCIAAGVDMIEIDVRTTKDGVHVLMHDATVTRTTNVNQLREEGVNGLPASDNLCDWTLEQLRQLRLVYESKEGNMVTNYVIPTFEDVVMVCADKIFVYLDVKSSTFDWEQDAYPLIRRYKAYRSITLPYSYSQGTEARGEQFEKLLATLETIKRDSGYDKVAFQYGVGPSTVEEKVKIIEEYNLPLEFRLSDYTKTYDTTYANYFGKYRIHVNAISEPYNTLDAWKQLHEKGYNFLHVDNYMTLLQYIAEQVDDMLVNVGEQKPGCDQIPF